MYILGLKCQIWMISQEDFQEEFEYKQGVILMDFLFWYERKLNRIAYVRTTDQMHVTVLR
jgi:hypothetical protein